MARAEWVQEVYELAARAAEGNATDEECVLAFHEHALDLVTKIDQLRGIIDSLIPACRTALEHIHSLNTNPPLERVLMKALEKATGSPTGRPLGD